MAELDRDLDELSAKTHGGYHPLGKSPDSSPGRRRGIHQAQGCDDVMRMVKRGWTATTAGIPAFPDAALVMDSAWAEA